MRRDQRPAKRDCARRHVSGGAPRLTREGSRSTRRSVNAPQPWRLAKDVPILVTLLAAGFAFVIAWGYGTFAAADTDPYGYVSQADLMASGTLHVDLGFARMLEIRDGESALVPPGYTLAPDRRSAVPVYSPGLPLVMAAIQRVMGERRAVFYAVPLLAILAVSMTYVIGWKFDEPSTGAMAAVLVSTSPVFLAQAVQPVSDLPAAAFWTGALALVLLDHPAWSLGAGLSASMAILTRPNLVPLAAVIGAFLVWQAARAETPTRRPHMHRVLWFAAGALPGCVAVGAFNAFLHGSPLRSGYAPLHELFGPEHVVPNLDRYPRWLVETHTPFVLLGLLAPLAASWRVGVGLIPARIGLLLAFTFTLLALNLFYVAWGYDESQYVRFMLPALPSLVVLSVAVAARLARAALPRASRVATSALVVIIAGLAVWQVRQADRRGVFVFRDIEARYVDVGNFIAAAMPPAAVFVASLHSGSIRYYSHRETINAGRLNEGSLDRAIRNLQSRGHDVFIVLEDGERTQFRDQFPRSDYSRLDWPPVQRTYRGVPVSIWDPRERAAYFAGLPVITGDIHLVRPPVVTTLGGGAKEAGPPR